MNTLKELVRSLAAIIILTSFLEMLLPDTKMKSYTRLVLGLFVIVTILSPILSFIGNYSQFPVQAWAVPSNTGELDTILENAEEITTQSQESAIEEYSARIEQQIAAIVKLTPEISNVEVEVKLKKEETPYSSGKIDKISIAGRLDTGDKMQESGNINKGDKQPDSKEDTERETLSKSRETEGEELEGRIQSIVSDFYGLMPDQVSVKLKS